MVYITGDMHGDISRLKNKALRKLKKNDFLIICGDFGFIWNGSVKEQKILKWIGNRRYNVLFVEGGHDNYRLICEYPEKEWNGGIVHEISGKLKHLCRGNIFNIENETFFAFGGGDGANPDDKFPEYDWWEESLPVADTFDKARDNLGKYNNTVDYVITHQPSPKIKAALSKKESEPTGLDLFFNELREKCTYKKWFFGAVHINKIIPPAEISLFDALSKTGENGIITGKKKRNYNW